jgi:cellulose synthase/poly-beta-1,6-N-acetylglucosamine synthase-like glycosyltransferase
MTYVFWIAVAWLTYVYAGYAMVVWILGLFQQVQPRVNETYIPTVSVLISARNEEKDIAWKLKQTLAWDYPKDKLQVLVASDASVDTTMKSSSHFMISASPLFVWKRKSARTRH